MTFDPARISYERLLEELWRMHDPTTLNRQGPDFGTQYRSAIFYRSDDQKRLAEASRTEMQGRLGKPIVTEITAAGTFWPAGERHQRYFEKRGMYACG